MSVERIMVNGRELTAFDLPPEPSDEYTVHVDGLGEVTVTRDGPTMHDKTAEYMGKMVDGLCAHVADLQSENAKLKELVRWMYDRMDESCAVQYPYAPAPISCDRLMQAQARARELGIEVDG